MLILLGVVGILLLAIIALVSAVVAVVFLVLAIIHSHNDIQAAHYLWNYVYANGISWFARWLIFAAFLDSRGLK